MLAAADAPPALFQHLNAGVIVNIESIVKYVIMVWHHKGVIFFPEAQNFWELSGEKIPAQELPCELTGILCRRIPMFRLEGPLKSTKNRVSPPDEFWSFACVMNTNDTMMQTLRLLSQSTIKSSLDFFFWPSRNYLWLSEGAVVWFFSRAATLGATRVLARESPSKFSPLRSNIQENSCRTDWDWLELVWRATPKVHYRWCHEAGFLDFDMILEQVVSSLLIFQLRKISICPYFSRNYSPHRANWKQNLQHLDF